MQRLEQASKRYACDTQDDTHRVLANMQVQLLGSILQEGRVDNVEQVACRRQNRLLLKAASLQPRHIL